VPELTGPVAMFDPKYYEETYSLADVGKLCKIGGFWPPDLNQVRTDWEDIAALYRWEAAKHKNLPPSNEVARDLDVLIRRIKRLDTGLQNLPEDATFALMQGIDHKNLEDSLLRIKNELSNEAPSLFVSVDDLESSLLGVELTIRDIVRILGGFEVAAKVAVDRLPKRRRGQTRDLALRIWMINIERLWGQYTSSPFTRDETDTGEPITPAARFCVAAFHHIAPNYPTSRILWEMRHCIKRRNKPTGGIAAKNGE
jgi:hypothetical protein